MSGTTCLGSPTVGAVRSWADIIEAYRPVVESKSSWARTSRPKISLCISAFQAKRHLKATIGSCLAQRDVGLELVIIDNNSSGGSQDILESVNEEVRIIRSTTTVSLAEDLNVALQQSNGRYVKLVCAGDTLHPDCIAEPRRLHRCPSHSRVVSDRQRIGDAAYPQGHVSNAHRTRQPMKTNRHAIHPPAGSVVITRLRRLSDRYVSGPPHHFRGR